MKKLISLSLVGIIVLIIILYRVFSIEETLPPVVSTDNPIETKKTIIALGDSLTAGYRLSLEDAYPAQLESILVGNSYDYKVLNAGVSGDTSKGLLQRLEWTLDEKNLPEIAIVVIGGNDGLRGLDIELTKENIISMIDYLESKGIKVVLGGMQIPPNLGPAYTKQFQNLYEDIAKEKEVFFIDFFLEGVGGISEYNIGDGIHPNKEGYSIIAENIYKFLSDNNLLND